MAENKKSFILYTDLISVVEKLTARDRVDGTNNAGELFNHILQYVNDLNPEPVNFIVEMAFEPIKQQLKRDLKKYESIRERNRINGLKGGRPKNPTEPKEPSGLIGNPNEPKKADNDNNNDNDNDNDIVEEVSIIKRGEYKKKLLSEIISDDFPDLKKDYVEITKSFQDLFRENLKDAGASTNQVDRAKGGWIDSIRLMIETDGYTLNDLRDVYRFLQTDEFWKSNILSTTKLREQMAKLKLQIKNGQRKQQGARPSSAELAAAVEIGLGLADYKNGQ